MQLTLNFNQEQCVGKRKSNAKPPDKPPHTHDKYSIEYCKREILTETYLWDMRCWNKYKDKKEVMAFLEDINNDEHGINCGHAHLCIRVALQQHGVPVAQVAKWIMENPHIQYKNRIVKCWDNAMQCPKFKQQRNYSGICEACE